MTIVLCYVMQLIKKYLHIYLHNATGCQQYQQSLIWELFHSLTKDFVHYVQSEFRATK